MANNYFSFKQFTIYHDQCAMKVGTDGVLLGAWTGLESASGILDVGTGSGLIAVMLAQRSGAAIDAVEIDNKASIQARENVEATLWHERISIFHDSFQHFSETASSRYDVIVSNPPYFQNSLKPPVKAKTMAKHDTGLDYTTLLSGCARLLKPGGKLSFIIPAADQKQFKELAYFHGLHPSRHTWVRPAPMKKYSRCLIEFSAVSGITCVENELIIRREDLKSYTADYMELTKDFYLGF